ncbi:MAG: hypothetical protein ABI782_03535 [Anaerolineaceae bacterium]
MEDFLWGLLNGITAWPLLLLHVFGIWDRYPVFNIGRASGWYEFGFLLGAGSPALGILSGNRRRSER